jgi:hypothetical protein
MIHSRGPASVENPENLSDHNSLSQMILQERQQRLSMMRELILEKQKSQQLEDFINQFLESGAFGIEQFIESEAKSTQVKVGIYPDYLRKLKIKKYKQKQKRYRMKVKISRKFKGRSRAAKLKTRINGRFAKKINN